MSTVKLLKIIFYSVLGFNYKSWLFKNIYATGTTIRTTVIGLRAFFTVEHYNNTLSPHRDYSDTLNKKKIIKTFF